MPYGFVTSVIDGSFWAISWLSIEAIQVNFLMQNHSKIHINEVFSVVAFYYDSNFLPIFVVHVPHLTNFYGYPQ